MSATLKLTQTLAYKSAASSTTLTFGSFAEQSSEFYCQETQIIPTDAWAALDYGDSVQAAGLFFVILNNLDKDNSVSISRTADDTGLFATVQPGEGTTIILNADYVPHLKADGAPVRIMFLAVSQYNQGATLFSVV